jgi:topoisomerase-4 subunit A
VVPDDEALYLLASDAGYGFVAKGEDLQSKNKSGKALITLPNGSKSCPPVPVTNYETDLITAITAEGRLLTFSLSEMPQLAKGKGNRIINIDTDKAERREDVMLHVVLHGPEDSLVITAGKRSMTLKPADLEGYRGNRAKRGNMLPKGLQKVDLLEVTKA